MYIKIELCKIWEAEKSGVTNFAMKESFNLHNRSHEGSGILAVHLLMYWNILPHTFWIAFHKLDWCDEYFLCIRFLHNSTVGQWLCWPLNFRQNTSFFSKYWSWVFGSFLVIHIMWWKRNVYTGPHFKICLRVHRIFHTTLVKYSFNSLSQEYKNIHIVWKKKSVRQIYWIFVKNVSTKCALKSNWFN